MSDFYQKGPVLSNQFTTDLLLRQYLQFRLPKELQTNIESDLNAFGDFVATDCWELENAAEACCPVHIPYSPWGERIDEIQVSQAWKDLHAISAREGLVAIGYEQKQGEFSRLYQFAKLYLFHPSSAFYSCPLAMGDGAAKLIQQYGDDDLKNKAFHHLTSRDPKFFWISGQWMTERIGGSDVGRTQTIAKEDTEGFRLYGTKYFCSATTAEMAIALARVEGDPEGNRGLSAFYIETHDSNGKWNGIRVNRLKDKLGTRALPTAELDLEGTRARLIGKRGQGVSTIATLFNITRIYNSVCALSTMRRALFLANDYAEKRIAFGKKLSEHPLHQATLSNLEVDFTACFHLTFHLAYLLGLEETGKSNPVLRMLTPLAKLFTGKMAVSIASEAIECIGGAAYIEDTHLPRLLRNAQVFPIWEGTTNILSLDVLRAIEKENVLPAFVADINERLNKINLPGKQAVNLALNNLEKTLNKVDARQFSMAAARIYIGSLLLEFADWSESNQLKNNASFIAEQWCNSEGRRPGM